tara:strand:- start:14200 stop:14544 length:345 start_codon:yes stop_codon:yes gene_type:complete
MKTKNIILVIVVLILGTNATIASTPEKMTINEKLRTEIRRLLEHSYFLGEDTIISAKVDFLVNQKGEIVVLMVDSSDERIIAFIKDRLNYKTIVSPSDELNNKKFSIPVKIVAK